MLRLSFRQCWRMASFKGHNAYCEERGYYAAILPEPSFRRKFRSARVHYMDNLRERLALKIAPWLEEGL